ncbi:MAG: class I SAM-dependent methyltransferase [Saprospiraceae bacterium]|nr:class I SAM-dependent methyltransferase [Saprospiraceae bacterium]
MSVLQEKNVTNWDKVYENSHESGGWSYLSRLIVRTLKEEIGDLEDLSMIELGCGSGRNSMRLAKMGANVSLLDLSQSVLDKARIHYDAEGVSAKFVQGNIFDIPLDNDTFFVVWNAGVIEHWEGEEQVSVIREMLRISKASGYVVTLNPNKSSLLHDKGKRVLAWIGKYAYTDEINIRTLEQQAIKAGGHLTQPEYSVGFFVLFVGLFAQLKSPSLLGRLFQMIFDVLNSTFTRLDKSRFGATLYKLDKRLSRIFGGYLLVSIMKKST